MIWTQHPGDNVLIAAPEGRVDETTWEVFLNAMNTAIDECAAKGEAMILDLAGLEYMSSRGLRVLTLARREADSKQVPITLARPNDRMREILAISRYDQIFKVTQGLDG
jgi:anti-sigma B factor antagonist